VKDDELDIIIKKCSEYKHDPYNYCNWAFDWGEGMLAKATGVRDWQRDIMNYIRDELVKGEKVIRIAVASGHGIGKSALISMLMNWALSTHENTKVVVTANTENQLKTKTWAEAAKWNQLSITNSFFDFEATSISYKTKNMEDKKNWRADMIPWSEKNTEAFAGLHNIGNRIMVIYDEASAIPDKIWEVTEGALTDEDTEIIWIAFGNPTQNTGRFRECFRKYKHRWWTKQIDSRTVEGTNKKQLQDWIDDYGEDSDFCKVRVRGMFPSAGSRQFIATEYVDAAYGKHLRPEEYEFAPVILGVDPAWEGDDMLVIGMRQGLHYKELRCIPKNDNDFAIAQLIAALETEYKAAAVFIDMGYGTGIFSAGKSMGRQWRLVNFAQTKDVPDKGLLNMRAKMWRDMRDWLRDGGSIPEDHNLYEELISPELVPRLDGKIQLEPKIQIKKRLGVSTDKADALALTFAFPVLHPDSPKAHVKKHRRVEMKMNPYSSVSGGSRKPLYHR